jgi:uncharacterized protein YbjQ (UPF0145 family)
MTKALYHARELAMKRLEEEADALGADGIVGVRLEVNLHAWGKDVAEFIAIGTAVRHMGGGNFRNAQNKPFQSDLTGQDFWTLLRSGYRPVGFVMGNCVYYVPPMLIRARNAKESAELSEYTHSLYDARELATERLQDEAEALQATGIVGVTFAEREHSGRFAPWNAGNGALQSGEVIELFVVGTAVVPSGAASDLPKPTLVLSADDPVATSTESTE